MKLKHRNVYFWDIIDTDRRYLLATHVSYTHGGKDAEKLMDLARRRAGKTPKVVVTDKLKSYIVGIEEAYGGDTKHRQGGPFDLEHSTALVERFHKTLEQRAKVFQKYKNMDDIRLLHGWVAHKLQLLQTARGSWERATRTGYE